jgi:hypothetical protein
LTTFAYRVLACITAGGKAEDAAEKLRVGSQSFKTVPASAGFFDNGLLFWRLTTFAYRVLDCITAGGEAEDAAEKLRVGSQSFKTVPASASFFDNGLLFWRLTTFAYRVLDCFTAGGEAEDAAEKLRVGSQSFKTVQSQLLLVSLIKDYLGFLDTVPGLAMEVAHRVVELVKVGPHFINSLLGHPLRWMWLAE